MSLSLNYPTISPSLLLDFVNSNRVDPLVTFTRSSAATYFDETGTLQTAGNNVPRIDFDPSTLVCRGLLVEEQRTNSIRNNTMQGAVAGTPGTNPNNWAVSSTIDGLTKEIVGIGTQNGIDYIDIRWYGTSGTASGNNIVFFEPNTQVVASDTQTWTSTAWVALVGGSLANVISIGLFQRFNNSGGSQLAASSASLLGITSSMQRFGVTLQANNATTAYVTSFINANFTDNSAVDFTLRIGLPQLELGAFATSIIPTTSTAVTRGADVASVNTLSPWYNAAEGTLYAEAQWAGLSGNDYYGSFNDGTSSNSILIGITSSGTHRFVVFDTGVVSASISIEPAVAGLSFKHSASYKLNDFATSLNGGTVLTDTSGTIPSGLNTFSLNSSHGTTNLFSGHLQRIAYYPVRLPNAQLQALTA